MKLPLLRLLLLITVVGFSSGMAQAPTNREIVAPVAANFQVLAQQNQVYAQWFFPDSFGTYLYFERRSQVFAAAVQTLYLMQADDALAYLKGQADAATEAHQMLDTAIKQARAGATVQP